MNLKTKKKLDLKKWAEHADEFHMADKDLQFESKVDEASRRKVHKAAKQGSYPAVIVVVQDGKVIHQEPVSTPDIAPATFNVMQERYPKAILHLEDNTGKRLFTESVNEAKAYKLKASEFGADTHSAAYNVKGEPTWRVHSTYAIDQVSGENNPEERDVVFFEAMPINNDIYIKIGGINNLKRTNGATVGNNFGTTIEEWKNNPRGIAKEASDFLTDAIHLKWINKKARSEGQVIKWALKDDYSSVIEDLVNKSLGLTEGIYAKQSKIQPGEYIQTQYGYFYKRVEGQVGGQDAYVEIKKGKEGKKKTSIHDTVDFNIVDKSIALDESVNEAKIKYVKGKTYQSSGHWTVYVDSNSSGFDIRVNHSAGWRLDPHDEKEETLELLDNGRQRATIYFKSGNIDKFAQKMFDLNDRTTGGNQTKLTAKDYADIIRVWIDMKMANESIINEWGSSDQAAFNKSMHKEMGSPRKMPSPFDDKLRDVAADNVDHYWDDWDEYDTDRDGLIDNAVRGYLRAFFNKDFEMMQKMFASKNLKHIKPLSESVGGYEYGKWIKENGKIKYPKWVTVTRKEIIKKGLMDSVYDSESHNMSIWINSLGKNFFVINADSKKREKEFGKNGSAFINAYYNDITGYTAFAWEAATICLELIKHIEDRIANSEEVEPGYYIAKEYFNNFGMDTKRSRIFDLTTKKLDAWMEDNQIATL